jgi:hypothetical protein
MRRSCFLSGIWTPKSYKKQLRRITGEETPTKPSKRRQREQAQLSTSSPGSPSYYDQEGSPEWDSDLMLDSEVPEL